MTKKLRLKISARLLKKRNKRFASSRKKSCRFCTDKDLVIDYKNAPLLKQFLTERAKILPSRISGNCAFHQRRLSSSIRQARTMALVPYCAPEY